MLSSWLKGKANPCWNDLIVAVDALISGKFCYIKANECMPDSVSLLKSIMLWIFIMELDVLFITRYVIFVWFPLKLSSGRLGLEPVAPGCKIFIHCKHYHCNVPI